MDARTGKVLDEKAKDESFYPASCTKVATLLYILTHSQDVSFQTKVVVPKEAVAVVSPKEKAKKEWSVTPSYILENDSTTAGLMAGEIVSLQDLLYGMMLPSGNDAANTLAYYWGGRSIEKYLLQINEFLHSIGVHHTHLCNPHGLHHPDHVTTAYDLALLTKKGLEHALFREIVKTRLYTKPKTNKQKNPVVWGTRNQLLKKGSLFLEEAIGVKTGYHQRAQHCFVAAAENADRAVIVVLLKHPDRHLMFQHAKTMLNDYLHEQKIEKELVSPGDLRVSYTIPGYPKPIVVRAEGAPFSVCYFASEKPEFEARVEWKKRFPPLSEKDVVGTLELYRDTKLIASLPLMPSRTISPTFMTRFYQFEAYTKTHGLVVALVCIIGVASVGVGLFLFFRRKA